MQSRNPQNDAADRKWVKFLAGWAFGVSIVLISLIVAIVTLVMPASQPNPLGETYFELMAAGHAPVLYRLTIMFDVAAWIGWGGLLAALAALLRRTAPVRSTFIALLASGMTIGFVGACLRIAGTPHFAIQYLAAAPAQQSAILQSYDSLLSIINITFSAGGLLAGIALLLVASAGRYLPKLSRWTTVLLGISGTIHLAKGGLELATGADLGPIALLGNILLIVALAAMAKKFYAASKV